MFCRSVGSLRVESWGVKMRLGEGGHSAETSSKGFDIIPMHLPVSSATWPKNLTVTTKETEGFSILFSPGERWGEEYELRSIQH